MRVKVVERSSIVDEKGKQVGAILSKGLMKKAIFCFLCDKPVSDLKHYKEAH